MQKTIFLVLALAMQIVTIALVIQTISIGQAPLIFTLLLATFGTVVAITVTIVALKTKWD